MKVINKILIANRGEIAVRIIRTAREMGISTVAVFSDADRNSLFVKVADEAVSIGGRYPSESYLDQNKIIEAARRTNADAIHPGYGFLSENADFAHRCESERLIFIGPSADAILAMGSKIRAKQLMKNSGVPVVPGYNGDDQNPETFRNEAREIGYPILIKASAGGGGKGMRIVFIEEELFQALESAKREAQKSFGNGTLLLEKYFPSAKHIEFQIFGDNHGNYTHFFDRECSIQRRYQKVIEESPSPSLSEALRKKMGEDAVTAARTVGYVNAGTVEFIFIPAKNGEEARYYFLEVNTRLQVEHPVTEMVTGLDLVRMQIHVAQGLPLEITSGRTLQKGHAIECRICSEDPENNFLPESGEILHWQEPQLPGVRFDSGVTTLSRIETYYDSLMAKAIVLGADRMEAIRKMKFALEKLIILGLTTNRHFLKVLLQHPSFVDGSFDTGLIERDFTGYNNDVSKEIIHECLIAIMLYDWKKREEDEPYNLYLNGWRSLPYSPQLFELQFQEKNWLIYYNYLARSGFEVTIEGITYKVLLEYINRPEHIFTINGHRRVFHVAQIESDYYVQHPTLGNFRFRATSRFPNIESEWAKNTYLAPMPGEIVKVLVKPGDKVKRGMGLVIMNSMKMETTLEAAAEAEVEDVFVAETNIVDAGTVLLKMKEDT